MFWKILIGTTLCRLTNHKWTDVELQRDGLLIEYERCPRCHTFRDIQETQMD